MYILTKKKRKYVVTGNETNIQCQLKIWKLKNNSLGSIEKIKQMLKDLLKLSGEICPGLKF